MKILFLSKDMSCYKAAMYQNEIIDEISRQADVRLFCPRDEMKDVINIDQIIKDIQFVPEFIFVGHSWLSDNYEGEIENFPYIKIKDSKIPKAIFLNKEYVRLEDKLDWIRENRFLLAFSHHHNISYYERRSLTKFYFIPFAFDSKKIKKLSKTNKVFDLSFSGILQNKNLGASQSDIRKKVMKEIFHTFCNIPIIKKKKYQKLSIFWNSIPDRILCVRISQLIAKYRRLDDNEYFEMQKKTKVFFNSPSPIGIVSPRIFENMACKCLPLCSESESYYEVFTRGSIVTFKDDLSDFGQKLSFLLENEKQIDKIIRKNFNEVYKKHTWKIRINSLMKILEKSITAKMEDMC